MNVKVLLLPDGEDPDSFARQQDSTQFEAYIKEHETDFIGFKTKLLLDEAGKDPIKKAQLISDIVRSISLIPDNIIRSVYLRECSKMMDIDESVLMAEMNKVNRGKQEQNFTQRRQAVSQLYEAERHAAAQQAGIVGLPTGQKNELLQKSAIAVLRYLVRYGDWLLYEDENGRGHAVADYIISELELDELTFADTIHQQMINEAKTARAENAAWEAEKYFVNHPDVRISAIAAELVTDPYQLSRIHEKTQQIEPEEKRLYELVPRVMLEYKDRVLHTRLKEVQEKIKAAQEAHDNEALEELLHTYTSLNATKNQLAKELGERIVLK
jgi:DNA primase